MKQGKFKFKIFLRNRPVSRKRAASDSENDEKVENRKRTIKEKTKIKKGKDPAKRISFFSSVIKFAERQTLTSGLYIPRSIHANIHPWLLTNDV